MKIKMLQSTNCDGKYAAAGSVVDASSKDARYLIATGMAEEFKAEAKKPVQKRGAKKSPANKMVSDEEIASR